MKGLEIYRHYFEQLVERDRKLARLALAYDMGANKLLDLLQLPNPVQISIWENEGGAL